MRVLPLVVFAALAGCSVQADYDQTLFMCADGDCPAGFSCRQGRCVVNAALPDSGIGSDGEIDASVLNDAALDATPPDAAPPLDVGPDADLHNPPWADPGYTHRMKVTIRNTGTTTLPADFQFFWKTDLNTLPGYTKLDDIHVYRYLGTSWSERERFIDVTDDSEEPVWVKYTVALGGGGTADYWMYWGNPTQPLPPRMGANVFDFYESFSASLDTTRWALMGAPTTASGLLTLDYNESIRSLAKYDDGTAVDYIQSIPTFGDRIWAGYQREADFNDEEPWIVWITRASYPNLIFPEFDTAGVAVVEGPKRAMPVAGKNLYTVERFAGRGIFRFEMGVVFDQAIGGTIPGPLQLRLTNESPNPVTFDMVRVRKTSSPFPTYTLGAIEPR